MHSVITRPDVCVIGLRGFPGIQGGVERHCEELYTRLAPRLHVVVFTRAPYDPQSPRWSRYRGVLRRKVWTPRHKYLEALWHTFAALLLAAALRYRVVHIHAIGPGILVPLARLLGFRVVFTHHGFDYARQKWGWAAKTLLRLGERAALRWSHEVLVVSREIQVVVERRTGRRPVFAPNGVQVAQSSTGGTVSGRLEPAFAVMVARIVPEKGWHLLYEALRRPENVVPAVYGVGGADHASAYAASILSDRPCEVTHLGQLENDEVIALLRRAAVFVLPSTHEGLPIALLEALAAGTVAVVSDIPAHREIVTDGVDGFLFRAGDAADLSRALNRAWLLGATDRQRVAAAAQTKVRHEYTWDQTAALVAAALQPERGGPAGPVT